MNLNHFSEKNSQFESVYSALEKISHKIIMQLPMTLKDIEILHNELHELERNFTKASDVSENTEFFKELLDIIRQLNSNLSLQELLQRIVDLTIDFIQADRGIIMLFNNEGMLEIKVARNRWKKNLREGDYKISHTVVKTAMEKSKSIFLSDITESEDLVASESVFDMQLRSVMCILLNRRLPEHVGVEQRVNTRSADNELMGILYLDSKQRTEESRFKGDNLELLQALADQATVAIHNASLHEKVNVDNLTELYLRHYFEENLKYELSLSKRADTPLCVMMIDIDYFKAINDRYGHKVGDDVLQQLGRLFKITFRASDIIARYGGEEFSVLLPQTSIEQAERVAEKLHNAVRQYRFPCPKVTVSLGISGFPEDVIDGPVALLADTLVRNADQALYAAKENGRDRTELWDASLLDIQPSRTAITEVLTGDPIRDYRYVQMLLESLRMSATMADPVLLLKKIMDKIIDVTDSARCILLRPTETGTNQLKIEFGRKRGGEDTSTQETYNEHLVLKLLRSIAPYLIETVVSADEQKSTVFCFQLNLDARKLGLLYLDSPVTMREFSMVEVSFIQALIVQMTYILDNADLRK